MVAEVYSVPSSEDEGHRRFAIFLCPDTSDESELYAESVEDASNLFGLFSSRPRDGKGPESRSPTRVHSDS